MRKRITRTLRLRRNIDTALNEIHQHNSTVATDSVFGNEPKTARLTVISASRNVRGHFVTNLQWEIRETFSLKVDSQEFQVYSQVSHKYWLRGLIRRCR
jgi:hypothetical protein